MWFGSSRQRRALLCVCVAVALAASFGSRVQAQNIDISDWAAASTSGQISINKNSVIEGTALVITKDEFGQGGSAFLRDTVDISKDFRVEFGYLASGSCNAAADGLALVFQPSSATYIGSEGLYMGMNPNSKLFGVWIDAFGNGEQGDVGGTAGRWHVGLARSQQVYWKIKDPIDSNEVCGRGSPANITVVYEKTNLQELSTTFSISSLMGQRRAFIGFTGSTGGAKIRQEIRSLQMAYLNTDVCPTFSNCSACTSSQCAWCSSTNQCQLGATSTCSRSCPRPRPPVAPPVAPVVLDNPTFNPCLGTNMSCSDCISPACVWGISAAQPQGICIPRTKTAGFSVFTASDQCSRVCSAFSSCSECNALGGVRGCGWCEQPSTGAPRCLHSSEASSSCSASLETICQSISKCSLFASESSVSGSNLLGNATFSFTYTGNGSVPLKYTLVARYRSSTGSLVQSITVNSSQYILPTVSQPGAVAMTLPFLFMIPASTAGVPELTIDANISSGTTDALKCAASSRPIVRPTEPQLSLIVNPSSIFTKTAVDIRLRVSKKGGARDYYFDACEWFFGTQSLGRTGADVESFSTRFNADRIVAAGQYQFVTNCTFSFSGFTSFRTIRRTVDATDITKVFQDTFFLPSPKIEEKPAAPEKKCRDPTDECFTSENSVAQEVNSNLRFNIGTDKEINLIVVKTGYKFDLEIIAGFKYTRVEDKGVKQIAGFANTQYFAEATLEFEVKEVFLLKGTLGAAFEWETKDGKFEPAKRTISGAVEFRRSWTMKKIESLPQLIRDKLKIEIQFGGGIKFSLIFKPKADNPDCKGVRLGSWVQCPPVEITPFLVAEGIARIGGRWAGFEGAISIEINAALRFGPFRFAGLTVPLKLELKAWLGFLRKSYSIQKTFCIVGTACGRRAGEEDQGINVVPGAEIPIKPSNPGAFIETVVASVNEYIRLDDYAETVSLAAVALDRLSKNFALAVWTGRDVSNDRPSNYRLSFSHILSNDDTPDGVSFSEAEIIPELYNRDYSDTNPTVSWMPNTDGEFVLVWTRVENASFVNTAPISANGSIMLTDEESAALLRSTSVVWATFKPGYGWTERGRITNDPSSLTSGAVSSRTDLFHPVYQPIIVAYESSRVFVNSSASDIQLMETKILASKFESSALEMSEPVTLIELPTSPARMSVASWGQHHNLAYEVTEFNGTADIPRIYYKTFGWNLTSNGTFSTANMASAAANAGLATPPCLLGSIGSMVNFAWANNFTATESLEASEVRFVLAWTCGPELWMGMIDPSSPLNTTFEVVVPVAGDSPILSWAHNETHITLTRWARDIRSTKSAYYMQSVPLSAFPPTNDMFKNAPSIRHARPTVQEDDIFTGYFQNDLLLVVSKDNLFNQKLNDGTNTTSRPTTTTVVKRRLVAAIFASNQKSEELLSVVCGNASYSLPSEKSLDTTVTVLCQSNLAANVTFSVLTGELGLEENIEAGTTKTMLLPGTNTIEIHLYSELLSGGFLLIDSDAPAFEPVRIDGPPLETEISVVAGSVEQLSLDPVVIQLDIRNFGITPPDAIAISVYLESATGKRILVGQYEDDDEESMPGLGDQLTYEIPLWGIDSPGVYEISISLYNTLEASSPSDFFRFSVEFRRTASITLLPHDLVPMATSVRVSIPSGNFFPTMISLVDVSTQQAVDQIELEDFEVAKNVTLAKNSATGPLVVCSSLVSLEETAEQLLENGLCTPVPFRELPRLTNSFAFLGLSAPDVRQVSSGSQLYYVVQPPRLSAPWGVMIRVSGANSVPSLAVSNTFLDASIADVGGLSIYRQPYLSASAAFSSFGELSAVDSFTLYASVHSASADTISTELNLVQFVDIDDAEPLLCDASAPVLFAMKPGRQGSAFLSASRNMVGAKMFLSTTGYAFGSGEGIVTVPGALSVFNQTIQIPMSFENGTTYFVDELDAVVETKWTLADLMVDQTYFVTLIAGDSAAAPFWLSVDVSNVAPRKLSSCPIQISASEAVPTVKATTLATGQIEVEISIRDEVTDSKNASRLDDISVTFGVLPQCVWKLKDPLMLASWTQVKSTEGSTCGRRIFNRVFDASEIGACFASTKRSLTSGAVTTVRTYRTAGSTQPQLVVTVSNVTVDRSPAPVAARTPTAGVAQQPSAGSDSFTDRPGFVGGIVFLVIVVIILVGVIVFLIIRQRKSGGSSEAAMVPMKQQKQSAAPKPAPKAEEPKAAKKPTKKAESSSASDESSEEQSSSASSQPESSSEQSSSNKSSEPESEEASSDNESS